MIFGICSHCTPLLLGTQVSDIGPSWSSCFILLYSVFGCKSKLGVNYLFFISTLMIASLMEYTILFCFGYHCHQISYMQNKDQDFIALNPLALPEWLSGECVRLMTWWL